jgi:hypothetical protein
VLTNAPEESSLIDLISFEEVCDPKANTEHPPRLGWLQEASTYGSAGYFPDDVQYNIFDTVHQDYY